MVTGFVIRRVFETDEGPIARWWNSEHGYGEPEHATSFSSKYMAEAIASEHAFAGVSVQRLSDAYAEVKA